MALIPIKIGNLSAMIEKPEPSRCSVPGCHGDHWTNCDYPIKRDGKQTTCDARLCGKHADNATWPTLEICPSHARLVAKGAR